MYSYVLHITGAADSLSSLDGKTNIAREDINAVLSGIESLSKGNGFDSNTGNRALNTAEAAAGDPRAAIQSILEFGAGELRGQATAHLVSPMVSRYLAGGEMSGAAYLSSVRVINFDLSNCVIVDRNGNVKLTAEYEIEYTFGALRLPFGPTLRVTQTAVTKAWLGGSGEGYRG